jgi:proline dehydrogenase
MSTPPGRTGLRRALAPLWLPVARRAARAYIPGPTIDDVMAVLRALAPRGIVGTTCFWAAGDDPPSRVAQEYERSIEAIGRAHLDCHLSMKPDALGFDPSLLERVLASAASGGVPVDLDSRGPELADRGFEAVAVAARAGADLGVAIPARWRRSPDDVERLLPLGVRIRVVKGQWPDPNPPDPEAGDCFMAIIDRLAGRARAVAVATHDEPLARRAVRDLLRAGTPCTLEVICGLPAAPLLRLARSNGVQVRAYVPFSRTFPLPYAVSRSLREPRILWWLIQDVLFGQRKPGSVASLPRRATAS